MVVANLAALLHALELHVAQRAVDDAEADSGDARDRKKSRRARHFW
jgi:hypothetical protein